MVRVSLKATVTFKNPPFTSKMIVNSLKNPLPPVNQGSFQAQLGPYEVCIYRFGIK